MKKMTFQILCTALLSWTVICFAQAKPAKDPAVDVKSSNSSVNSSSFSIAKDSAVIYGKGIVHDNEKLENPRIVDLIADVWYPQTESKKPRPAVILVHGGGFKGSYKAQKRLWPKFPSLANYLVPRGYAVMTIDYRLHDDYPPAPSLGNLDEPESTVRVKNITYREVHAAIRDTKAALRWMHKNGPEKYNIDPENIFLVGTSAGACTVLGAGIDDDDYLSDGPNDTTMEYNCPGTTPKPAGIVSAAGTDSFVPDDVFEGKAPGISWPLEKGDYDPDDPPVMIWHGTEDRLIEVKHAHAIHKRCKNAHIPSRLYIIEGGGHVCWGCEYEGKSFLDWMYIFFEDIRSGKLE